MFSDLIYDVGLNHGEDTSHYLAKGFRVVAIEANPVLAQAATDQFQEAISEGRLTVLNVGIGPAGGEFDFWVNDDDDVYSSFIQEVGARGGRCHAVRVRCRTFAEVLAEYGIPYYLKIDIEQHDRYCLGALNAADLPRFVSVEAGELANLCTLRSLGYNAFKCVDQTSHNDGELPWSNEHWAARCARFAVHKWRRVERNVLKRPPRKGFPLGSSGPFGEDTPGPWLTLEEVAYNWLHFKTKHLNRGTLNPRAWFDFHATVLQGGSAGQTA
jgi:FkbM family methyltransferase